MSKQYGITIPQVLDPVVRTIRTGIQVAVAFVTIAPLVPLIVHAINADGGSQTAVVLTAVAAWVTTVAGVIARIMAIPGINRLLASVGLSGHSGVLTPGGDTFTTFVPTIPAAQVDAFH